MNRTHVLGELQHAIMRVLWSEGQATVARVTEALPRKHRRALTTIATMLTKMEKKGVVAHKSEGRVFVYRPTVPENEVRSSMIADLTEQLFDGDRTELVAHLLSDGDIEPTELARLQELIRERQQEQRRLERSERHDRKGERGHGRD